MLEEEAAVLAAARQEERGAEWRPSPAARRLLEGHAIEPHSPTARNFPWARWRCQVCVYHLEDLEQVREHLVKPRHGQLARARALTEYLRLLPPPSAPHLAGIQAMLDTVHREEGLSTADLAGRAAVAARLEELLSVSLQGCSVRMFGSSLSGLGLRGCPVDLDLEPPPGRLPGQALLAAARQSGLYTAVAEDFTSKMPAIHFAAEGLACQLSCGNGAAVETGLLLRDYLALDGRARCLGTALRLWGRRVGADRGARARPDALPPHALPILLVYFLQQRGVLPCILAWQEPDEPYSSPAELAEWRGGASGTAAELWVEFFRWLVLGLVSAGAVSLQREGERTDFKGRRLTVEDPFGSPRNLCRKVALPVLDYLEDCFRMSYLYFGSPAGPGASYSLEAARLAAGPVPPPQCPVCQAEGHLQADCPDEQLPARTVLPVLEPRYLALLDSVCGAAAADCAPGEQELRDRARFLAELTGRIQEFWPAAELTLFGSSINGLSFRHSDLDISLTFRGIPDAAGLDCADLVEQLAARLERMPGVSNVLPITSAKVPIVKLCGLVPATAARLEADISLYNVLARENTRMLALYSSLDPRVQHLGYMVKLLAKRCDIGDASKGALSSYAYTLLMIFYLQQVRPAVLPVLQQLVPRGTPRPEHMVDGWDAWFQEEPHLLAELWRAGGNPASLAQLWVGFLDFYSGSWDDEKFVVSIRQQEPLTKFEKMWTQHQVIAIEDPFDLSHNLGSGLYRKMWLYIKRTFLKARELFGLPLAVIPANTRSLQDHFFAPGQLARRPPPKDRNCYECGRIGHIAADCPSRPGLCRTKGWRGMEGPGWPPGRQERGGGEPEIWGARQLAALAGAEEEERKDEMHHESSPSDHSFDYSVVRPHVVTGAAIDYLRPLELEPGEPEMEE
jgi:DNA polymerase sigma